ncbi:MAG: RluA family pseudouridine synthase [Ilumatobacteraceae bacterium]
MTDQIIEVELPGPLGNERLDRVVALLGEISRSVAQTLIAGGFVAVDGATATSGKVKIAAGHTVRVDLSGVPREQPPLADASVEFRVVYDDEHVAVIDKPAGLVVHPAVGNDSGTLVNGLLARYPEIAGVGELQRPGIVHRLDGGTSGLLVVARTEVALATLQRRLAAHDVERIYLALVWGHPSASNGMIDAPIGRHPNEPLKMAVVVSGKPARTRFEVLATYDEPPTALVRCELETGRTHQIRVHLAAVGHPVVADAPYGGARSGITLARPFLHATQLAFDHPVTGEPLSFVSPLPADLVDVVPGELPSDLPA